MAFNRFPLFLLVGALGILCAVPYAGGQSVLAALNGTVHDQSGAVVPNAAITIENTGTSAKRDVTTNGAGIYEITNLLPGDYSLTIAAPGLREYSVPRLHLEISQRLTVNATLSIAALSQQVEVSSAPPPLNKSDATLGTVIQQQEIVQLPLNGRNFTQLALLAPGAAPHQVGQQGAFTIELGSGGINPSVNGMRSTMNNYTLDGVDNNMRFNSSYSVTPPPDAIFEFKVQTQETDARTALSAGANINVATRSGTKSLHGSAWEFLRNDKLAANGYFNNFYGSPKLPYKQNQYGYALGGPVYFPKLVDGRKSHTYFFNYWEGFRSRRSSTITAQVPTAAMRTGDLSSILGAVIGTDELGRPVRANEIYDPATIRPCSLCASGFIRDPYPNNVIPTSALDAIALGYLQQIYPLPNRSSAPNFETTGRTTQDSDQFGARIDQTISDKITVFGRVSWYDTNQASPLTGLPSNQLVQTNSGVNIVGHYTQVLSPTTLLELEYGYNRASIPYRSLPLGQAYAQAVGPKLAFPVTGGFLPTTQTFAGDPYTAASWFNYDLARPDESQQIHGDVQKTIGSHQLGAGVHHFHWDHNVGKQGVATVGYVNLTTNQPDFSKTGDALASFLVGLPSNSRTAFLNPVEFVGDVTTFYGQDFWKVTPNLTVNLGLQLVFDQRGVATDNQASVFDYAKAKTQPNATDFTFAYLWAGKNPVTGQGPNAPRTIIDPHKLNFSPRIGIAYSPVSSTVIRAGFGTYYDYGANLFFLGIRNAFGAYPYQSSSNITGQNTLGLGPSVPPITLENPFSNPAGAAPVPRGTLGLHDNDPYALMYSLGIEQSFGPNLVFTLGYVGSAGRNLVISGQVNLAPPGPGAINPRRPLPNASTFIMVNNQGYSSYNALQSKIEKHASHGLLFRNSFTWSKSIDQESDPGGLANISYYEHDRRYSRGPSDYDIPIMDVISTIYDLPVGKGRTFGTSLSGPLQQIVGGWQLAGLVRLYSGNRFFVLTGSDSANMGDILGLGRPNVVHSPVTGFHQSRAAWFDTSAFQVPSNALGNESRNFLRGPAGQYFDLSGSKTFLIKEPLRLEFRADAFNVLNHTVFGLPSATTSSSTFGQILSASSARDIQFSLKLLW